MAEFCLQCARDKLNLMDNENDFRHLGQDGVSLRPGYGWHVLCEGCGHTVVDNDGRCIAHWCEVHGEENKVAIPYSET